MTLIEFDSRLGRVRRLLARLDHWHVDSEPRAEDTGTKEWQHFCVFTREVDLLINFSLMDGVQTGSDPAARVGRVAVLARHRGRFGGGVERIGAGDLEVRAGNLAGRFAGSRLSFSDGRYRVRIELAECGIAADLEFEPRVTPAITDSQPLGPHGSMRWLVVPRLSAKGVVRIGESLIQVAAAPAYHDHDWGVFRWGAGFTWNWAVALPDDDTNPWVMAATQIGDAGRASRFANSFLLWRRDRLHRAIRGPGIMTRERGQLRPERAPFRIPAIMNLACPGSDVDVPARYEVRAEERGDVVELAIDLDDYAQIAIPNDGGDRGTTLLSECCGRATAHGRVRGDRVELSGPALLELVHVRA